MASPQADINEVYSLRKGAFPPSRKVQSSGGSSLAEVPGSSIEKIDPKSWLTFLQVFSRASRFFSSSSAMTWQHRRTSQGREREASMNCTCLPYGSAVGCALVELVPCSVHADTHASVECTKHGCSV